MKFPENPGLTQSNFLMDPIMSISESAPGWRKSRMNQVCGYLSGFGASPPFRYSTKVIVLLLDERGACAWVACPGTYSTAHWVRLEPVTSPWEADSLSIRLSSKVDLTLSILWEAVISPVYWTYLLIAFNVLVLFLSVLVIPMCGGQNWSALWSTFGRTI